MNYRLILLTLSISVCFAKQEDCDKAKRAFSTVADQCDKDIVKITSKVPSKAELDTFCDVRKCFTDGAKAMQLMQKSCQTEVDKKFVSKSLISLILYENVCLKNAKGSEYCFASLKEFNANLTSKSICECSECGQAIYGTYSSGLSKLDPKYLDSNLPPQICNPSDCPPDFISKSKSMTSKIGSSSEASMHFSNTLLFVTMLFIVFSVVM
jgi:hypothetical protein